MNKTLAQSVSRRLAGPVALLLALSISANQALACAVCYGDPESPLAKGAAAGVLVLMGVVGFVLLGVAGTGMYWVHRGRRLSRLDQEKEAHTEVKEDPRS